LEHWQSGLSRLLGKQVTVNSVHRFESCMLRMFSYIEESPYPSDGLLIGHSDYNGLKIMVMGKYGAQQYIPESGEEVCISICCKNGPFADKAKLSGMFAEILYLRFDDLDGPSHGDENAVQINEKIANKVVEFVLKHKDKKKLLLHCYAGINRSRSMAQAIAEGLELPYHFTVNNHAVYQAVQDAFQRKSRE
jgi:predicted protein tyrosine phosphatase